MSVQEKIRVIAHDLQERIERWQAGHGFTRAKDAGQEQARSQEQTRQRDRDRSQGFER